MGADRSKITGADSNEMSKNYECQIAYLSNLRVLGTHEPVANKGPASQLKTSKL